jgi:hypothetical protein
VTTTKGEGATDPVRARAATNTNSGHDGGSAAQSFTLQSALGNFGTQLLFAAPGIAQAKLGVGQPDDPLEVEADRVADQVMRREEPDVSDGAPGDTEVPEGPNSVQDVLASPGQPLDADSRTFMESRFDRDLSDVRIHSDEPASRSAQAVSARAYTVGTDIAFQSGEYAPETSEGRHLLAHELAHVVQQSGGQQAASVRRDDAPQAPSGTPETAVRIEDW